MTAVPDPSLRDQLVKASTAVADMAEDWWCPKREGLRRTECRFCIAEFTADALLPLIAAHVQAATTARAQERVRALHRPLANSPGGQPACPDCLGGIYAEDPDATRPCGCWGLATPVCSSCADYSGGRRFAMQWPCPTAAALAGDRADVLGQP